MEVVKAAVRLGLEAQRSIAVSAAQRNYSYGDLLRSALRLSAVLKTQHLPSICSLNSLPSEVTNGSLQSSDFIRKGRVSQLKEKTPEGFQVGIVAKPCAEFITGMWAIWLSGAVAVPLAFSYPPAELLHVVTDAGVSLIVGTKDYQGLIEDLAKRGSARSCLLPCVPAIDESEIESMPENVERKGCTVDVSFEQVLTEVAHLSSVKGEKPGLIIYTSGTTGKPKGVVHTHAGMAAQVKMLAEAWNYTSYDRFLHCLPLHHVHGLFNMLLAPLYVGAKVDFMSKFSVGEIWQRWCESYPSKGVQAATPVTVFSGVPTMYVKLLQGYNAMDQESQKQAAFSAHHLRLMMSGSSALPKTVMRQWEMVTGQRMLERYGMTEFVMALSNPLIGERKAGTVGKPLPGVQVKIVEEEENGEGAGELCVKSPSMFKEYWRQPQITKESFGEDGYFRTGDYAAIDDDGYIIILGRKSTDIIKVGGFKLSALEIEAVLLEHPTIADCTVVGLPDRDYGEAVCALVVPSAKAEEEAAVKSQAVLTLQQLHKWAKERLAPYKIPKCLQICQSLPRNAMGKVNKKELREQLSKSYALSS